MNVFKALLPFLLLASAGFAVMFAFSKPVSLLPRWVRHAYLLLAGGMGGWAVVNYIRTHYQSSFSEHAYSLLLQGQGWLAGFTTATILILIMANVFPTLLAGSKSADAGPGNSVDQ
jgi:hypothetical protein